MTIKGTRMSSFFLIIAATLLCSVASVASAETGGSGMGITPLDDGKYRLTHGPAGQVGSTANTGHVAAGVLPTGKVPPKTLAKTPKPLPTKKQPAVFGQKKPGQTVDSGMKGAGLIATEGKGPKRGKSRHVITATDRRQHGTGADQLVMLPSHVASRFGAYCLDGTHPGYYLRKGLNSNANKWIIFFQGGGWCFSQGECRMRSLTTLGSSRLWTRNINLGGMLSADPLVNPKFFDYNVVQVNYCDGTSFMGDVEQPLSPAGASNSDKGVYLRGKRIVDAVLWHIMNNTNLKAAGQVLLGGGSAGGLAAMHNCDRLAARLPRAAVRCLADASFFMDTQSVNGNYFARERFHLAYKLHNASAGFASSCTNQLSSSKRWRCYFPQYFAHTIRHPLLLTNSFYDSYQLDNFVVPLAIVPRFRTEWAGCLPGPRTCSPSQWGKIQHFHNYMTLTARNMTQHQQQHSVFLYGCFTHTSVDSNEAWGGDIASYGHTLQQYVGSWFSHPSYTQSVIDCQFPCTTCGRTTAASSSNN